jgi:hypothetical protein
MPDLVLKNPATTDQFRKLLAATNVKLPVQLSETDVGVILDTEGRDVLTVDSENQRDDAETEEIASLIVVAINTCGGFKTEVKRHG